MVENCGWEPDGTGKVDHKAVLDWSTCYKFYHSGEPVKMKNWLQISGKLCLYDLNLKNG